MTFFKAQMEKNHRIWLSPGDELPRIFLSSKAMVFTGDVLFNQWPGRSIIFRSSRIPDSESFTCRYLVNWLTKYLMGTSPCYVAGKIHHFYGPCSISYVKLPEPSCEEEAMQLERDVDKIKLDVQDAVKKAPSYLENLDRLASWDSCWDRHSFADEFSTTFCRVWCSLVLVSLVPLIDCTVWYSLVQLSTC